MLGTSGAYVAGELTVPCLLGVAAAFLFIRWDRKRAGHADPTLRTSRVKVRQTVIALLLGAAVFAGGATLIANEQTRSPSALDGWFSGTWNKVASKVSSDYDAIGAAVLSQSLPRVHSACEKGLTTAKLAVTGPRPPISSINNDYAKWLRDVDFLFASCSDGTKSKSIYLSAPGQALLRDTESWVKQANIDRKSLVRDVRRHGG